MIIRGYRFGFTHPNVFKQTKTITIEMKIAFKKEQALKYLLATALITTTICFLIKYLGMQSILPWNLAYNDLGPWYQRAVKGIPYIENQIEYPVMIGFTMFFASQFGQTFWLFSHYFLFLIVTAVTTFYLYKLSELLQTKKINLFLFWAASPTLLWFVYYNWDIITVMFSVMALYYFKKEKDVLATVLLSLGFATKMYPILFLFPVLLHRPFRDWIKLGTVFVITFLTINLYFIINSFSTWYYIYGFHSVRPPNIDSIWGLIVNIFPSLTPASVNTLTLILFAGSYLIVMILFRKADFIKLSFVATLLFLLINKVFSPQFILWLLPFFALYGLKLQKFYTLEIVNAGVLFATLPYIFSDYTNTTAYALTGLLVIIRHIILFAILYHLLKKLKKPSDT